MSEEGFLHLISVSGEIPLKSPRTKPRFFRALAKAVEDALGRRGVKSFRMWRDGSRVFLRAPTNCLDTLSHVFGVRRACVAVETPFNDLNDLSAKVAELLKDVVRGRKFAVRVKRVGKHDFTSVDAARAIGSALHPYSAGVDLTNPEVEVRVEIRGSVAYVIRECVEGPGGLPAGTEGRVLTLFSGGFDSPVAAWMAAKRGLETHFLHFVLTSPESASQAFEVARKLATDWLHGYRPKFIVVDYRRVVEEVVRRVRRDFRQVVLRALMYVGGWLAAERFGFDALVTGEAVGQASSQTLRNLAAVEEVVARVLGRPPHVLRPLACMDKEEIISLSKRVGTHDLSARVAEYCAIAPSRVVTRAKPRELAEELGKVSLNLVRDAVASASTADALNPPPKQWLPDDIEIDYIPEGAVVVDMRSLKEYREWHYPGAIHVSEAGDLRRFRDRPVVLYCSHGYASYLMAEHLRREGVRAYSVKGGVETLKRLARGMR